MRTYFASAVLIALLLATGILFFFFKQDTLDFVNESFRKPCTTPIAYRVGTIDPRFGLTKETVVEKLETASALWSTAYGQQLFIYSPSDASAIPINFVYDRRQQTLTLSSEIDSTGASQLVERSAVQQAQAVHAKAQQMYAVAVEALNKESSAYSREVQAVNARGGATPQEYAQLNAQKEALDKRQQALRAQGEVLAQQSNELKVMIDAYNAKVKDINQVVQNFNATAGGDFEEGQYVQDASGKRIYIYAYKNQNELLHILAHELGHALGLDHNQNPQSIMFPYNKSGVTLSSDDLSALRTLCTK